MTCTLRMPPSNGGEPDDRGTELEGVVYSFEQASVVFLPDAPGISQLQGLREGAYVERY